MLLFPKEALASCTFIVGLRTEARLLRPLPSNVEIGGGDIAGARDAADRAVAKGARALISFGLAGGLDPDLPAGALIVPRFVRVGRESYEADAGIVAMLGGATQQVLLAGDGIVGSAVAKQMLWRTTGAAAVDLESGAVAAAAARHKMPFAVLRAVCDPAARDLPPAALIPLVNGGGIPLAKILASVARNPTQLPALLGLARDAAAARKVLTTKIAALSGPQGG